MNAHVGTSTTSVRAIAKTSVWQSDTMQEVVPFVTSLAIHLGIVVLIVMTCGVVRRIIEPEYGFSVAPADCADLETDKIGIQPLPLTGAPTSNHGNDPLPDTLMDLSMPMNSRVTAPVKALMSGPESASEGEAAIGVGSGAPTRQVIRCYIESSEALDRSTGLPPISGESGYTCLIPSCCVFCIPGRSLKVAYVCDASGSMLGQFDGLRQEIGKSVNSLKPTQAFNIIFFQEGTVHALSKETSLLAKPEAKEQAVKFLQGSMAHGASDPIPALELAFPQKPQLVFLVADGDFADNGAVLAWIRAHNADKKIKINTLLYMSRGGNPETVMKQIAAENGGTFRMMKESE